MSLNFRLDLAIFAHTMGDNLCDATTQVAIVEDLPSLGAIAGLSQAKAHLMGVVAHLLGDTTFQGQALELHAASVAGRAMRLAQAFACEDLAAERSGRRMILDADQWRQVHQAVIAGCSGQVPILRRNGTFRPPLWAVDLLELTGRLGETGWADAEIRIKARAMGQPSPEERRAAEAHNARMIAQKAAWVAKNPEARDDAEAWWTANRHQAFNRKPRPVGCLRIDHAVYIRLPAAYRTPAESAEVAEAKRQQDIAAGAATVLVGRGGRAPFVAHKDVLEILRDNRRKASEFARGSRRGRQVA
jgi:hypothetical protein